MRLIDADALIAKINERLYDEGNPFPAEITEALDMIEKAPTVDTTLREVVAYECGQKSVEERPKGKWISHYDYCAKHGVLPSSLIAFWWCEQCEQAVEQPTNFCPNCGARMER